MTEMLLSSLADARLLKASKYFSGKACPKGHVGFRYTINSACVDCTSERGKAEYLEMRVSWLARALLSNAKTRAQRFDLPFELSIEDIEVPEFCPVLGIRLEMNKGAPAFNSPSLDRVVPKEGYVRGNVVVISHRANRLKNDATLAELRAIVEFYEGRQRD